MSKCEQCVVRELSALKALNQGELNRITNSKTSYVVKKGQSLFEEGQTLNGIFCIRNGVCKISKLSDNGKNHIVKLITRGDILGERSLVNEEPLNLSATALEDMEVCFIPKPEILELFKSNTGFSLNMLKNVCENLKEADNDLVNMAQKNVKERLAKTLIYLQDKFGINEDKTLKIQLSREELSGIVGTALETCIRLLSELKKEGYIDLIGKKISIKNERELRKMI
ncbi:MAG: Crp/Fnr family transcriptional regulator [Flavobacteriaceae bacterium]